MQEIVPPKLNQNSGLFSIILTRRNILFFIGFVISMILWGSFPKLKTETKSVIQVALAAFLIIFMADVHGRAMHHFLLDFFKYLFKTKKQKVIFAKDIIEGIIINPDSTYSIVYKINPINLSMVDESKIHLFKQDFQNHLSGFKYSIQLITIVEYSALEKDLKLELARLEKLTGILKKRCEEYITEYANFLRSKDYSFYLITGLKAKNITDAKIKLNQLNQNFTNSIGKTANFTRLSTEEILHFSNYLLPTGNELS